jgi:putative ABC transport system permease protein
MIKLIEELADFFNQALETLWGNKMRSVLTMLGVVIGVFAVITLVAIGEGAKQYIYDTVSSFGSGSAYMEAHPGKDHGPSMGVEKLTYQDAEAIEKYCPDVSAVDPRIYGAGEVRYGKEKMNIPFVMCVSYKYPEVLSHKVVVGRFFNKNEEMMKKKVCIVGQKIVTELLSGLSPIGERIKINAKSYTIIGVFENKGSFFGFDYNKIIIIPITAGQQLFDTKKVFEIGIAAKSDAVVYKAKEEVKQLLIKRHKKEDFRLDTQEESLSMISNILGFLTLVIGGIASISLLVGGIGIMNIMLVSVNERVREIGIRKSVGATKRDIFLQFLVESVVISMLGGTIGIVLGVGASMGMMKMVGITPVVSLWSAGLAYFVSILVGVISGVYPAMRAAALDPVEALRYE